MEIRDNRAKEWFWLDNEYLNGYAKHLGVMCTNVYISLCRHADNSTQKCFPSMEMIGEEIGTKRNAVSRAIKTLKEWNIIDIEESYDVKNKRRKNNVYTLLSKKEWKEKPRTQKEHGAMHPKSTDPCTFDDESHALQESSNKTHINKTHITIAETSSAEVSELIKSFETINPASKKFYGNKTQRGACESLIKEYGFERVKTIIEKTLPKTNGIQFFPIITTPLQLFEKWASLESAVRKYQSEKLSTKDKYKVAFKS